MVEKWTLNSLATALVDIPTVSMVTAHSLKTSVALCCDKLHILKWPLLSQHKVHLCNDQASSYATPVRWMDYLGNGGMLTNRDINKFVN
jgi:hypothetical protein